MVQLNLPKYSFKIKNRENKLYIFDIIRKKYVVLTPEEWVRQHFVHYLNMDKKYPKSIIAIEKQLKYNGLIKRTDILVFDKLGQPDIIVECKSPNIKISQDTFDQIARYNLKLNANFLVVTNGIQHFYCKLDHQNKQYVFLEDLAQYS
jgi:hypothetical protein